MPNALETTDNEAFQLIIYLLFSMRLASGKGWEQFRTQTMPVRGPMPPSPAHRHCSRYEIGLGSREKVICDPGSAQPPGGPEYELF